ncbi:molecular chaperone HtpG [Hugenholtzia roseola]|uniref:molecular chaperone HtpG n=1 Tax=Hugenholtzia roseola TaxID=1002 RepID=UPI00040F069A|nr:molecular chaperone HtpG [Hugenholtzia roseola]
MLEQGTLSVNTENIFPIIKKFLYSDNEIFLRELVANAVDATQKIKRLSSLGEYSGELGELQVEIKLDKEAKTLTISDKGIGMTAEEIKKYINQIAFSGATEFVEKYKDQTKEIIGHFGLGFYSAFMVAKKVEILTKSYQDAPAALWSCEGSTSFSIEEAQKEERGTDIILHIAPDSEEFLEKARLTNILNKHCKFLPIKIVFEGDTINNTEPLWVRKPADLQDEDYLKFYKELYPFSPDPLFWIHLNVDYPFNLTGILYFPKVRQDLTVSRDKIQLYSRQVFITDEVKDIVPEFLTLLHGVLDSPDIPLNVSRSYLQADGNVRRISNHIMSKVAEKLNQLFKEKREDYAQKWDDIGLFVKYGAVTEEKFFEKVEKSILFKNIENQYFTLEEYKEKVKAAQTDKDEKVVLLYTTDPEKQHTYIQSAQKRGYDVLQFDTVIDPHFTQRLESKQEKLQIKRVDADSIDKLIEKAETLESVLSESEKEIVKKVFEEVTQNAAKSANRQVSVAIEGLPESEMPVVITQSEMMRRFKEMNVGGAAMMGGAMPEFYQAVVNGNHALIRKIATETDAATQQKLAQQAFDLALLSQHLLSGKSLSDFIERSLSHLV